MSFVAFMDDLFLRFWQEVTSVEFGPFSVTEKSVQSNTEYSHMLGFALCYVFYIPLGCKNTKQ